MQRNSLDILLLGEGNFTFTYSLVKKLSKSSLFDRCRQFSTSAVAITDRDHADDAAKISPSQRRPTCSVLATAFDAIEVVLQKYPESLPILEYFDEKKRVNVKYVGGVNATQIQETLLGPTHRHETFHPQLILFNNPHIGIEDLHRHRSLLSHTFASVCALPPLPPLPREVVIALCDDQPRRWGLLAAAARSGLVCVAAVPLLEEEFPDYAHARGQSDARFPYKRMVQYYFSHHADFKGAPALHGVIRNWWVPRAKKESNGAIAPQFETWCRIYDYFYGNRVAASQDSASSIPSATGLGGDGFYSQSLALQHTEGESECNCMPLVHPSIAFYTSAGTVCATEGSKNSTFGSAARNETCFSPYLDLDRVADMYRLQMEVEGLASQLPDRPQSLREEGSTPIPYHLDSNRLGRPLNAKETAKLERYLRGYGCAKEGQIGEPLPASLSEVHVCSFCPSSRWFTSLEARDYHVRSKHGGVNSTPSSLHTKAYKQIIGSDYCRFVSNWQSELHEARRNIPQSEYCSLCDLLFVDHGAFQEHLQFLTPQGDPFFVCKLCEPSEMFVDERALLQHKVFKHPHEH